MNQQQAKTIASVVNAFFKQLGGPRADAYVLENGDKYKVRFIRYLDNKRVDIRSPAECARVLREAALDCAGRALSVF